MVAGEKKQRDQKVDSLAYLIFNLLTSIDLG